jgi:hypothetical protein
MPMMMAVMFVMLMVLVMRMQRNGRGADRW